MMRALGTAMKMLRGVRCRSWISSRDAMMFSQNNDRRGSLYYFDRIDLDIEYNWKGKSLFVIADAEIREGRG